MRRKNLLNGIEIFLITIFLNTPSFATGKDGGSSSSASEPAAASSSSSSTAATTLSSKPDFVSRLPRELQKAVANYLYPPEGGCGLQYVDNSTQLAAHVLAQREVDELAGVMLPVKGGTFIMGSPESEHTIPSYAYIYKREKLHQVKVEDFYLGKNLVTQGQYKRLMEKGYDPSKDPNRDLPMVNVNYWQTQKYILKLNAEIAKVYAKSYPGRKAPKFRIPNEKKWEYAAGTEELKDHTVQHTKYSGTDEDAKLSEFSVVAANRLQPVGSKKPNSRGFYDMVGNAAEWTSTVFHIDPEKGMDLGLKADGTSEAPPADSDLVLRGGSFLSDPQYARAAVRGCMLPEDYDYDVSFRLEMYY